MDYSVEQRASNGSKRRTHKLRTRLSSRCPRNLSGRAFTHKTNFKYVVRPKRGMEIGRDGFPDSTLNYAMVMATTFLSAGAAIVVIVVGQAVRRSEER